MNIMEQLIRYSCTRGITPIDSINYIQFTPSYAELYIYVQIVEMYASINCNICVCVMDGVLQLQYLLID